VIHELDNLAVLPQGIRSRSINAENPDGAPGAAARASSHLGPGRKGRAFLPLPAGERLTLAEIEGPGVIRHIWITVPDTTDANPFVLRNLVLRIYWDGSEHPAVEAPLGDFFCNGFAERALVTSIPIVVAPTGGMNSYFAMPFRKQARIVIDSEHPDDVGAVFFQIDYTAGDELADNVGTFHAQWRRSNGGLGLGNDHIILDGIVGTGRYLGTFIGLTALERYWWGEGEVKFYLDNDTDHPTQCSTGLEDYAGGAWAFQDALRSSPAPEPLTFSAPYFGYPQRTVADTTAASPFAVAIAPSHGLYRWHLPDPILFGQGLRVTLQQIGAWDGGLFERNDDICSTAYWYQTGTAAPFPSFPRVNERRPR
jgi:hypothetical protein